MVARKSIDMRLEELAEFCASAKGKKLLGAVTKALSDPNYRLVAKAATICDEQLLYTLEDHLVVAYRRLLDNPIKKDPNCIAKSTIMRTLVSLDYQYHEFYLAGMRYRQLEPTWGGAVDTALDLRCSSAMGLVVQHVIAQQSQ